jgi:hypothetical protein
MKKVEYFFRDCKFTYPMLEISPAHGGADLKEIQSLYTDKVNLVYAASDGDRHGVIVCFLPGEKDEVSLS